MLHRHLRAHYSNTSACVSLFSVRNMKAKHNTVTNSTITEMRNERVQICIGNLSKGCH